jgi:poly-gamma-glutamate capsule biosynthesis protein CapA/YwtB (metallophosphatase superfamily)
VTSYGSAMLSLLGDVMIETPGLARSADDAGLRAVVADLERSSLVIGNLEMPLSRRGYRVPKHSNLRSDPAVIEDIRALRIAGVSLANNHMMDYGPEALRDTIETCEGAGIAHCGAGADLEASLKPAWFELDGKRIGLLSISCTLPVESDAGPGKPGIAPVRVGFSLEIDPNLLVEQPGTMPVVRSWTREEDVQEVCRRVREMKSQADLVIVAVHWGVPSYWLSPYQGLLTEYQQPLAHALVEAGAGVIVGHHSHELHPIEVYKGAPILYSLGNFLFEGPRDFMRPESVVVSINLEDRPRFAISPLLLDERGVPRRAEEPDAARVLELLERLSAPYHTRFTKHAGGAYLEID